MLGWKKLGHEKRLAAYIVNYADDPYFWAPFVLVGKLPETQGLI